jgi:hypothetical protein
MHVFGHDDISDNYELISTPHALKHGEEEVAALRAAKMWLATITTEGDEV